MLTMIAEWWREKLPPSAKTVLAAAVLFAIGAIVSHKLFTTEYLPYLSSIEGAYIGLSRYILEHFGEFYWFPLWYGGIPFENTYPPLLHFSVAALSWLTGFSPALAHHVAAGLVYCLSPVTVFLLAYRLSSDRIAAFVAGLFSALVSWSAFLMPSMATDLGGLWGPRRLQTIVVYSDTPHQASLLLIPVALIALDCAIKRLTPLRFMLAVLAFTSIPLTNWHGAFIAALAVAAYLLAQQTASWERIVVISAFLGIAAYAIASPWIPPSLIATIRHNAQFTVGSYALGIEHLLYASVVLTAAAALTWLLHRTTSRISLRFAALFALLVSVIPLAREYMGIYLFPQPERYHIVMEMAIALLAAFLLLPLLRSPSPLVRYTVLGVLLLFSALQVRHQHSYADTIVHSADVEHTLEKQVAAWLAANRKGERVFATGSVRYWLTVFSENPQLGGGFDQGIYNALVPHVTYAVVTGQGNGESAVTWLKAYGIQAIVVGGPETRDAYHDFRDPAKFEGLLPEIWRDGDDVVYSVPQRTDSLARVILLEHVVDRQPADGGDTSPVMPYIRGLDDTSLPIAPIDWRAPHHGVIDATLESRQLISLQMSYHPGWEATVNGRPLTAREDGLGLMLLEPGCDGPCHVELTYTGGLEMTLAKTARGLVLALGLIWLAFDWKQQIGRNQI